MAMDLQLLFYRPRGFNLILTSRKEWTRTAGLLSRLWIPVLILTIDRLQLGALLAFSKPTTVPEALRVLIVERKCPAFARLL